MVRVMPTVRHVMVVVLIVAWLVADPETRGLMEMALRLVSLAPLFGRRSQPEVEAPSEPISVPPPRRIRRKGLGGAEQLHFLDDLDQEELDDEAA